MSRPPITLDVDLLLLVEELFAVLLSEPKVVRQQQVLELLIVKQAMRIDSRAQARIVVDGIHKHTRQLLEQFGETQQ